MVLFKCVRLDISRNINITLAFGDLYNHYYIIFLSQSELNSVSSNKTDWNLFGGETVSGLNIEVKLRTFNGVHVYSEYCGWWVRWLCHKRLLIDTWPGHPAMSDMMMMMLPDIIIIIIIIYFHQNVQTISISSSISCDNCKEQLKLPSLMNNSSSKSSTDALSCGEIYSST